MRWYSLIIIVMVLLCVSTVMATENSIVEATPINNQISLGETAEFKLSITNRANQEQRYSVVSFQSGQGWNVDPYPLSDKVIILNPGQRHSTMIRARPLEKFSPGIYFVSISVESTLGDRYEELLKVYLGPEKPLEYLPSIKVNLEMDDKIDPKQSVSVKMFLENKNPLDLSGLVVKVQSDIPEFAKEIPVGLDPLGKKIAEFSLTPNRFQQPKDYNLFFVFENKGEIVKVIEKKISVDTLLPSFEKEISDEKKFLITFSALKITNDGNVLNTQEVVHPVSFIQSLFTRSDAKSIVENGERYLMWEVALRPNESKTVNFVTNYRLLLYLLIVLIVFMLFYTYVKSPVIIKKKAVTIKSGEDGALSEIKITLELCNRSRHMLNDIDILDVVPTIANIEKSLELGTVKPKEIRHTQHGTKVIWSLVECDAHEHRLITYKIRAKLNILGVFSLPRATVSYKTKFGRKGKAYSNQFKLSG